MTPTLTISIGRMAAAIRGTKESGKRSTHAAHDHDMFIFIVKTEEFSDCVSDTSAHLQGGTFTAGRSAEQVRDQCGNKDQRSHAQGQLVIRVDGRDDQIGSGIFFIVQQVISTDNDQSPDREQIQQPGVLPAQHGDKCQAKVKCGAAQSDDTADKNCKNYPFDRHQCTVCIVFDFMFYDIVHNSSPHNPFSSY